MRHLQNDVGSLPFLSRWGSLQGSVTMGTAGTCHIVIVCAVRSKIASLDSQGLSMGSLQGDTQEQGVKQ